CAPGPRRGPCPRGWCPGTPPSPGAPPPGLAEARRSAAVHTSPRRPRPRRGHGSAVRAPRAAWRTSCRPPVSPRGTPSVDPWTFHDRPAHRSQPAGAAERRLALSLSGLPFVQRQVHVEHVHAGLAEYPEDAALDVSLDECPDLCGIDVARRGHTVDLQQRGGLRDVGVEPAEVGGDEVDRHLPIWAEAVVFADRFHVL